ncbi:hypothetical protein FGG08_000361 [Glutinoglossum americanum]|uniref:Phosphotransferase n=1 Tax=Glutinoglossum americanum TaxID=1670608 RepID=A0A9P8ID19_9PEZI|nr:hypothetical protein FGG08_000361 [Glutinoglossum americanum]
MAGNQAALDTFLQPLSVDTDRLQRLAHEFATTYRHLALNSNDQFLPTPITTLPSGQERGRFLAIDLGGTNLRVGFIELLGSITDGDHQDVVSVPNGDHKSHDKTNDFDQPRIRRTFEKAWPIGEHLKMDKAEDLFAWIGDCIAEVVADSVRASQREESEEEVIPEELPMGVTFSFPMIQHSLAEATLMPMGKGFAITSNLNLGKLLLAGYERHIAPPLSNGISPDAQLNKPAKRRRIERLPRLRIAAITNDTVATLASLAYTVKSRPNSRVAMGLIVGTGTNATIPMKLTDLHPSKQSQLRLPQAGDLRDVEIVVNTEWTINGTAPPLKRLGFITKWDKILDEASEAPGFQPFEYMTAGRYLGELARLIILDYFTGELGIQEDNLPAPLRQRNALTTTFLATVIASSKSGILLLPQLQESLPAPELSGWQWSIKEAQALRKVAKLVQRRSAGLIAAAIIGLLECTGELELKNEPTPDSSIPNGTIPRATDEEPHSRAGIEDLVVAYTGGTISRYPEFLGTCQCFIDELLSYGTNQGNQNRNKSVILKEAVDGGIIGAGVLAGTACA